MNSRWSVLVLVAALVTAGFFVMRYQVGVSHGIMRFPQVVEIRKGENLFDVGTKLQDAGIIAWRGYFAYYIVQENLRHAIVAGKYQLNGTMTIPEIADSITNGEVVPKGVSVVFPEGFDSQKIADRLTANALPGEAFLDRVNHPKSEWRERFWFLKTLPADASLEGFLFPDTYTFPFDVSAETIVESMLANFEDKFPADARAFMDQQKKNVFDVVTLASIVEREVRTETDRKMVADIFWRRLSVGQPLQSDATIAYARKENKVQHSFEETRVDSPYNTYINKGLPPGPISNPGVESLSAVIVPTPNPYFYFLSDTKTGETIFSVTFDEHVVNKTKHGL